VEARGGGCRVELAGLAFQGKEAFVEEFAQLGERARERLGAGRSEPDTTGTTVAREQPGALTRGD